MQSSSVALAWLQSSSADRSRSPAVAPSRRAHHRSGRPVVNAIYRPLSGFSGNSPFSFHFNPFHPILILFVCFRPFPLVNSSFLYSSLLFKLVVPLFCYFVYLNTLFSGKAQIAPLAVISKRHNFFLPDEIHFDFNPPIPRDPRPKDGLILLVD